MIVFALSSALYKATDSEFHATALLDATLLFIFSASDNVIFAVLTKTPDPKVEELLFKKALFAAMLASCPAVEQSKTLTHSPP